MSDTIQSNTPFLTTECAEEAGYGYKGIIAVITTI